jgi:hypothetical protein
MAITDDEYQALVQKSKALPNSPTYLVDDYVTNLLLTVVDFMTHTKAVERAIAHYEQQHYATIRTHADLKTFLEGYPDTKEGNTAAATSLFGYKMWTRVSLLRRLLDYFESRGVTTQSALRQWAATSSYATDFEGKVPGLGYAVYNWLVMRQGVESIKPDVHVRRSTLSTGMNPAGP